MLASHSTPSKNILGLSADLKAWVFLGGNELLGLVNISTACCQQKRHAPDFKLKKRSHKAKLVLQDSSASEMPDTSTRSSYLLVQQQFQPGTGKQSHLRVIQPW